MIASDRPYWPPTEFSEPPHDPGLHMDLLPQMELVNEFTMAAEDALPTAGYSAIAFQFFGDGWGKGGGEVTFQIQVATDKDETCFVEAPIMPVHIIENDGDYTEIVVQNINTLAAFIRVNVNVVLGNNTSVTARCVVNFLGPRERSQNRPASASTALKHASPDSDSQTTEAHQESMASKHNPQGLESPEDNPRQKDGAIFPWNSTFVRTSSPFARISNEDDLQDETPARQSILPNTLNTSTSSTKADDAGEIEDFKVGSDNDRIPGMPPRSIQDCQCQIRCATTPEALEQSIREPLSRRVASEICFASGGKRRVRAPNESGAGKTYIEGIQPVYIAIVFSGEGNFARRHFWLNVSGLGRLVGYETGKFLRPIQSDRSWGYPKKLRGPVECPSVYYFRLDIRDHELGSANHIPIEGGILDSNGNVVPSCSVRIGLNPEAVLLKDAVEVKQVIPISAIGKLGPVPPAPECKCTVSCDETTLFWNFLKNDLALLSRASESIFFGHLQNILRRECTVTLSGGFPKQHKVKIERASTSGWPHPLVEISDQEFVLKCGESKTFYIYPSKEMVLALIWVLLQWRESKKKNSAQGLISEDENPIGLAVSEQYNVIVGGTNKERARVCDTFFVRGKHSCDLEVLKRSAQRLQGSDAISSGVSFGGNAENTLEWEERDKTVETPEDELHLWIANGNIQVHCSWNLNIQLATQYESPNCCCVYVKDFILEGKYDATVHSDFLKKEGGEGNRRFERRLFGNGFGESLNGGAAHALVTAAIQSAISDSLATALSDELGDSAPDEVWELPFCYKAGKDACELVAKTATSIFNDNADSYVRDALRTIITQLDFGDAYRGFTEKIHDRYKEAIRKHEKHLEWESGAALRAAKARSPRDRLISYGRYCGPGAFGGEPINGVDACCRAHDLAYGRIGINADVAQKGEMEEWQWKEKINADLELCRCASNEALMIWNPSDRARATAYAHMACQFFNMTNVAHVISEDKIPKKMIGLSGGTLVGPIGR